MDPTAEQEEKLRESSCMGDGDSVQSLLDMGVEINAQNGVNGWTALHWAAKRNHAQIVQTLLNHGADITVKTHKGETAAGLATDSKLHCLLGSNSNGANANTEELPIVPNYLANPPFPHVSQNKVVPRQTNPSVILGANQFSTAAVSTQQIANSAKGLHCNMDDEVVLKARVANIAETDFIEVELDKSNLTFEALITMLCAELEVKREFVAKVRKLPDTILRKDKDVKRLKDFQEIEVVMSSKSMSESSRHYGPSVSPKHIDVVY